MTLKQMQTRLKIFFLRADRKNVEKLYSKSPVNSLIQLLQTAPLFCCTQRDCQQGLARRCCSHNPPRLTHGKCRIRLMAHFIFHVAPEHAVAESLSPISKFPAWLLIMEVIRNEELCQ